MDGTHSPTTHDTPVTTRSQSGEDSTFQVGKTEVLFRHSEWEEMDAEECTSISDDITTNLARKTLNRFYPS